MRGESTGGKLKKLISLFVFISILLFSSHLYAQVTQVVGEEGISKPVLILFVSFLLSIAPFILMMTTSFVKIAVVLSLVRSALGTQQIPPNPIITGLALILTVYVMIPVGQKVYDACAPVIQQQTQQDVFSMESIGTLKEAIKVGKEPVREFLLRHAHDKERKLFYNMGKRLKINQTAVGGLETDDFMVLIPAFVISELSEAFQIGFIIFLPFLVIDMVVSNVLLSMGMFQLSPITVSLPFKLLLFVLVDGWYLITEGLVNGYIYK